MPPPMMPAPSTAAWLISLAVFFAQEPAAFLTAWSARNSPMSALACGVTAALAKYFASMASASSRPLVADSYMLRRASMGAG